MTEWEDVDDPTCYKINVFDDGNYRFKKYENKWFIISKWIGKVHLINIDKKTEIRSISRWKLIEDEN
jgi:hypothetical protein